jgi:vitamin B12 transporter
MKKHFFVLAAAIISNQLQAQDSTVVILDEAIVTAGKYPRKQSETGKVVTIITRQQIEKSTGSTTGELLNTLAGTVVIGANNVLGTNQTISIRGASAGNVLILIDGIPANDPSVITNYYDLNFLPLEQIERIEVLKGGQSTLYGSDAVAGVINIISKKAGTKKAQANLGLSAGSFGTFKQTAGINGRVNKTDYSFNYTHTSSSGFSAANDKNNAGNFDKDGFDQHALNARMGYSPRNNIKIYFTAAYNRYKADLDAAAFTDDRDFTGINTNRQAGAGVVLNHKKGNLQFNYNYNLTKRDYTDDSTHRGSPFADYVKSSYTGNTHFAEIYNTLQWQKWELLAGFDYRSNDTRQSYFSKSSFGPYTAPELKAKINQVSPYASAIFKNNKGFTLELGGRFNYHSEYGSNTSFTFNPLYLVKNKFKLFGNLYSAYKVPTLYQLFDAFAGNADLEPEKGMIGEVGAEVFFSKSFTIKMVGFYRRTHDAIVYTFNSATFAGKYLNASKQTNYGAELEAAYVFKKINIGANYTYTNGKTISSFDGTGSPIGKDTSYFNLYRIPRHALNLNAGIQATKELFLHMHIRSVSKREEFIYGGSPEILRAYTTADISGEYKFGKRIKAFVALKNITNTKYVDIQGYNPAPFNVVFGIHVQL